MPRLLSCILLCILLTLSTVSLAVEGTTSDYSATQTTWTGGASAIWPYTAQWSDLFYRSYGIDWQGDTGALILENGFRRELLVPDMDLLVSLFTPSDIDSDGDIDLFLVLNSARMGWLERTNTAEQWVFHETACFIYQPKALVTCDFDGNGLVDLAATSREDGLVLMYQIAPDQWELMNIDREFYSGWDIEVQDIDANGSGDIVGISWVPNYICWWSNPVSIGTNWEKNVIAELVEPRISIQLDDYDGDGEFEICVLSPICCSLGIQLFEPVGNPRELWHEIFLGSWMENARELAVLRGSDRDYQNGFRGLVLGESSFHYGVTECFILNSDYTYADTLASRQECGNTEFIRTGDIDGDGDMDICLNSYCFINTQNESTWTPLRYLDVPIASCEQTSSEMISNVMCFDIDGNGTDELVYLTSGKIWFVDHSRLWCRGELVSHFFEPEKINAWQLLSWTDYEPIGTSLTMYFRFGRNADWIGPFTEPVQLSGYETGGDNRFQCKVVLESTIPTLTPVLQSVTVEWR
jgi:hypothetical protein